MTADLFTTGPIAIAQLTPDVLPRSGDEVGIGVAFPALVLRVVAFASAHLLTNCAQDGRNLPGNIVMRA